MFVGHSLADSSGVILAIDQTISDFLWRPHAKMIGMSYLELTHPADRAPNARMVADLKSEVAPRSIRKRYIRGDGAAVWANVQVSRLGAPEGRLIGTCEFDSPGEAPNWPYRLWRAAITAAEMNRARRIQFGADLVNDPAWALMIEIYLAEAEGRGIDSGGLATLTSFPRSLVERWLAVLDQRGIVEITGQRSDSPQLTQEGIRRIERVLGSDTDDGHRATP